MARTPTSALESESRKYSRRDIVGAERNMDRAVALMPYRPFYSRRHVVDKLGSLGFP